MSWSPMVGLQSRLCCLPAGPATVGSPHHHSSLGGHGTWCASAASRALVCCAEITRISKADRCQLTIPTQLRAPLALVRAGRSARLPTDRPRERSHCPGQGGLCRLCRRAVEPRPVRCCSHRRAVMERQGVCSEAASLASAGNGLSACSRPVLKQAERSEHGQRSTQGSSPPALVENEEAGGV